MTTEQKLRYIEGFRKLLAGATCLESAKSHAGFLRGVLAAWNADGTITLDAYRATSDEIEVIMAVKRTLPKYEGVGF